MRRRFFTSESVTEGHPDKVADRISDRILDALLTLDPEARVAAEALVTTGRAIVAGEFAADASFDAVTDTERIVREAVRDIGYDDDAFAWDTIEVESLLHGQSADIAGGVLESIEWREGSRDPRDRLGAGDQGIMFGYAVDQTPTLMPMPIDLAHRLSARLAQVRRAGTLPMLRPDGKTQVTVQYEGRRPVRVHQVLISTQHAEDVDREDLEPLLRTHVIEPIVPPELLDDTHVLVNPSGRFVIGGPHGDTGLTGRKIVVDTYGGYAPHGGGAFSGKDPTKVDRSASYAARWAAKNVVAAGLAAECEIQLAYAIGQARPFSIYVETFGTEQVDPVRIEQAVQAVFDFRPQAIIEDLRLRRPIYAQTSVYGHFGRELPDFTWEATDRATELAEAVGLAGAVGGA